MGKFASCAATNVLLDPVCVRVRIRPKKQLFATIFAIKGKCPTLVVTGTVYTQLVGGEVK